MSIFRGTRGGKVKARTMAHDIGASLNLDNYHKGNHLYLAGPESGDINHALSLGIHPQQIFAAEWDRRSYESAVSNTKGLKNQIYHDCIVECAKKLHSNGIVIDNLFLDVCNTLTYAKMLLEQILPYVSHGCTIATNISSRDRGLKVQRNELKSKLSEPFRSKLQFNALARQANEVMNELKVYFSVGISYANTDSSKKVGAQMLTLIGRRHNSKPTLAEPAYMYRFDRNGTLEFGEESPIPTVRAFKAHLPGSYKMKADDYLKIARYNKATSKSVRVTLQAPEKKVVSNHIQHTHPLISSAYELRVTDAYRAGHTALSITRKMGKQEWHISS